METASFTRSRKTSVNLSLSAIDSYEYGLDDEIDFVLVVVTLP